jgi:hypothetical protein
MDAFSNIFILFILLTGKRDSQATGVAALEESE